MEFNTGNEQWRSALRTAVIVLVVVYVCALPLHIAWARLQVRRRALRTLVSETHSHAAMIAVYLNDRRADLRDLVESGTIQERCRQAEDSTRLLAAISQMLGRFGMDRRLDDEPVFSSLVFVSRDGDYRSVPVPDAAPVGLTYDALRSLVKQLFIRPTYFTHLGSDGQPVLLLSVAVVSSGAVHGQLLAVLNPAALNERLREAPPFAGRAVYLLTPDGDVYVPEGTPPEWRTQVATMMSAPLSAPVSLHLTDEGERHAGPPQIAVRSSLPASDYSIVCIDPASSIPTTGSIVRLSGLYLASGAVLVGLLGMGVVRTPLKGREARWVSEPADGMKILHALFDNLPDGVLVADTDGQVQFINNAFQTQQDITLEEARGHYANDILGDILEEDARGTFNRALQGRQTWIGRLRSRRSEGGTFTSRTFLFPVHADDGSPSAVVAVRQDITPRVQAEERLRQAQKMEAVGVLADGIAHDFNNLLTVIQGNCNLLLYGAESLDTFARDNIDEILRACDRAAAMTRRLLAFSRHREVQMQVLDLNDVVGSTEKMLNQLIRENVEMNLLLADDPVFVKADLVQVEQIIITLTVNARDAMPRGGSLTVKVDRHHQESREPGLSLDEGAYAVLTVADTGHGMDELTKRRIFDPFFTTKSEKEGTGLGLTTVVNIVEEHGGCITVDSEVDVGTTFKVYLPLHAEEPTEEVADISLPDFEPREERPRAEYARGEGPGILILDDEESVLRMIERALDAHGYRVFAARTDVELLVTWEQHRDEIRLLITDMVMPGMSGVEIADRLREDAPELKVLNISAYTDTVIMKLGGKEQSDTLFLQKPFTPDILVDKVDDMLSAPMPENTAATTARS